MWFLRNKCGSSLSLPEQFHAIYVSDIFKAYFQEFTCFLYCLSMANTLEIDLTSAILDKIELNKKKYPADLYRGKARLNQ